MLGTATLLGLVVRTMTTVRSAIRLQADRGSELADTD
jgi:hypothetical protein